MAGGGGKSSGAVGFQGQLRRGGARAQVRSQGRQLSCHPPRCQLPPRVTRICWGVSGYSCIYNHCRSSRGPSQTCNETPDTTRHPVFKCDKRYKWPRRQDATGRDAVRQWPALVWQHGVERASTCGGAGLASRPPESSPTGATCTMAMVVGDGPIQAPSPHVAVSPKGTPQKASRGRQDPGGALHRQARGASRARRMHAAATVATAEHSRDSTPALTRTLVWSHTRQMVHGARQLNSANI